jgi:hypothetical protein
MAALKHCASQNQIAAEGTAAEINKPPEIATLLR